MMEKESTLASWRSSIIYGEKQSFYKDDTDLTDGSIAPRPSSASHLCICAQSSIENLSPICSPKCHAKELILEGLGSSTNRSALYRPRTATTPSRPKLDTCPVCSRSLSGGLSAYKDSPRTDSEDSSRMFQRSYTLKEQMSSIIGDSMEVVKLEESLKKLESSYVKSELGSYITRADSEISDFIDDNIPELPESEIAPVSSRPSRGSKKVNIEPFCEIIPSTLTLRPPFVPLSKTSRIRSLLPLTNLPIDPQSEDVEEEEEEEDERKKCPSPYDLLDIRHVPTCCYFEKTNSELIKAFGEQPTASICSCAKMTDEDIRRKLEPPKPEPEEEPQTPSCKTCFPPFEAAEEEEDDYYLRLYACVCQEPSSETMLHIQELEEDSITTSSELELSNYLKNLEEKLEEEEKSEDVPDIGTIGTTYRDVHSSILSETKIDDEFGTSAFMKKYQQSDLIDYERLMVEDDNDYFQYYDMSEFKVKPKERVERRSEAETYLKEHRIQDVFQFLGSQLLAHVPDNPIGFLVSLLDICLSYREGCDEPPMLFDFQHVESLYKSMEPFGRRHISMEKYNVGMYTLQIKNYNKHPKNTKGYVNKNTFIDEAMKAMVADFDDMIRVHSSSTKPKESTTTMDRRVLFGGDKDSSYLTFESSPHSPGRASSMPI